MIFEGKRDGGRMGFDEETCGEISDEVICDEVTYDVV